MAKKRTRKRILTKLPPQLCDVDLDKTLGEQLIFIDTGKPLPDRRLPDDPTPEEIAAACREIQKNPTKSIEYQQIQERLPKPVEIQVFSARLFDR